MAVDRAVSEPKGAQQHVSEVVDRLRGYWRLTQAEAAEGIGGMNQQQLSARLNCERHWNEEHLAAVAAYFKVDVGDLYGPPDEAVARSASAGGPDNASFVSSAVEQPPLFASTVDANAA